MRQSAAILLLVATVLGTASTSQAIAFRTFYLKRVNPAVSTGGGRFSERILEPCISLRDDEQTDSQRAQPFGAEAVFPFFFSLPEDRTQIVPEGDATVRVYLTTGPDGEMQDCADVTAQLFRETEAGRFLIAQETVTASILPRLQGGIAEPISVVIPVTAPEPSRTLAPGDVMTIGLRVRNNCVDGEGRTITLRYDSLPLASHIEFDALEAPDDGATADPDDDKVPNLCDNCPDIPNRGQEDSNRDGVGDACTPCVSGGPTPPECACLGGCDDDDVCTTDACDRRDGCFSTPIPFLDGVRCRLDQTRELVDAASPDDLDEKLQGTRSPLRRKLRKSFRRLERAEAAVILDRPKRKIGRRLKKLRRALTSLVNKIFQLEERDRMSTELRDELALETEAAIERTTEVGKR